MCLFKKKTKVLGVKYSTKNLKNEDKKDLDSIEKSYLEKQEEYSTLGLQEHNQEAEKLLENEEELKTKLDKTDAKFKKIEARLKDAPKILKPLAYIPVFLSLIKDFISKKYRTVPKVIIVAILAALIYFLVPFDLISDWIPTVGYLDDAGVITACIASFKTDLDKYIAYKEGKEFKEEEKDD